MLWQRCWCTLAQVNKPTATTRSVHRIVLAIDDVLPRSWEASSTVGKWPASVSSTAGEAIRDKGPAISATAQSNRCVACSFSRNERSSHENARRGCVLVGSNARTEQRDSALTEAYPKQVVRQVHPCAGWQTANTMALPWYNALFCESAPHVCPVQ